MVREEQQYYCSSTEPKEQCGAGALGDLSMGDVLGPPVVCYIHLPTCIQIWISVHICTHIYDMISKRTHTAHLIESLVSTP